MSKSTGDVQGEKGSGTKTMRTTTMPAAALIQALPHMIMEASDRIRPHILETPMFPSSYLSELAGGKGKVWLKLESEQYTGSFKARGSLNKVLSLTAQERNSGVVTSSTGNHAQGFGRALAIAATQQEGRDGKADFQSTKECRGIIYLPENADPGKVEALRQYTKQGGLELVFHGTECSQTEVFARDEAKEAGMLWVSPYNDPMIIAGQGTVGLEMWKKYPNEIDTILVTIGGGGLMSGIASWFRHKRPKARIIGCLPANSPEMYLSVKQGEIVSIDESQRRDTLSDGSAGGIEPGAVTFDICRDLVDDFILVEEGEIAHAIRWMAQKHHKIVEGAAGVALGAFLKEPDRFDGENVAIVICGANIGLDKLTGVLTNEADD